MPRALKAATSHPQEPKGDAHGVGPLDDLLTTAEAAARLRYPSVKSFLKWADRERVPRLHRGRVCLWRPQVLTAFLERKDWTRGRPVLHARRLRAVAGSRLGNSAPGKDVPA